MSDDAKPCYEIPCPPLALGGVPVHEACSCEPQSGPTLGFLFRTGGKLQNAAGESSDLEPTRTQDGRYIRIEAQLRTGHPASGLLCCWSRTDCVLGNLPADGEYLVVNFADTVAWKVSYHTPEEVESA